MIKYYIFSYETAQLQIWHICRWSGKLEYDIVYNIKLIQKQITGKDLVVFFLKKKMHICDIYFQFEIH